MRRTCISKSRSLIFRKERRAPLCRGQLTSDQEIMDRDIGSLVDTRFMHFGIVMSETPTGDKAAVL
jgi:hypothetical protein